MKVLLVQQRGDGTRVARELERRGLDVTEARSAADGWSTLKQHAPDVVVADLGVGRDEALGLLRRIRDRSNVPVVIASRGADVPTAVCALKQGATEFFALPAELSRLAARTCELAARATRPAEADALEQELVGRSSGMVRVRERVQALAPLLVPVLVVGDRGTGRDTVIRALHTRGPLSRARLVRARPGERPSLDPGRVYYLDGVTRLSPAEQAFWGDALTQASRDVRVVASTETDLVALAREERFDPHLAEGLARFTIPLPRLCDRPGDLPDLTRALASAIGQRLGRPAPRFERSALARFRSLPWAGNVAELAEVIERIIAYSTTDRVLGSHVDAVLGEAPRGITAMRRRREEQQRDELVGLLDTCGGNLAEVARRVGMSRGAIIYRAQKYGLLRKGR